MQRGSNADTVPLPPVNQRYPFDGSGVYADVEEIIKEQNQVMLIGEFNAYFSFGDRWHPSCTCFHSVL